MARVLIVEDEPLIAMMLKDWLAEMGYETVGPAGSVEEAVARIEGSQFDAVLLDLHLHGIHAGAVAERLHIRGVPFVIATGDSMPAKEHFAGAPRLLKPYDFEAVRAALTALLHQ